MKIVIGISGASGVIYGITLLKYLNDEDVETHLIISDPAKKIITYETKFTIKDVKRLANYCYENNDLGAKISSGSTLFDAMVIVPCSMSTLSKIAYGFSDNLITRAAQVCLKENRQLILVPRETPLNSIHLENMFKLSKNNSIIILPAMPGFYGKTKTVDDLVNFVVGKILDMLGLEHNIYERWEKP